MPSNLVVLFLTVRGLRDDARRRRIEAAREVFADECARLYAEANECDREADRIEAEMRTVDKE
jgi:hypothetical protein